MPELEVHRNGRHVILAICKGIGPVLSQASDYSEAIILSKAASILCNHMIDNKSKFNANIREGCIENSAAPQCMCMIEQGDDIKSQLRFNYGPIATVQLLCEEQKRSCNSKAFIPKIATPFPIYIKWHQDFLQSSPRNF